MSNITVKNITKIFVIIAVAAVMSWFAWNLSSATVSRVSDSLAIGDSGISLTQEKLDKSRKELKITSKYVRKFKNLAIKRDAVPSLLNRLETVGNGEPQVVVSGVSEDESSGLLHISVSAKCPLVDCIKTAREISVAMRMIGVEHISMQQVDTQEWALSMGLSIPLLVDDL